MFTGACCFDACCVYLGFVVHFDFGDDLFCVGCNVWHLFVGLIIQLLNSVECTCWLFADFVDVVYCELMFVGLICSSQDVCGVYCDVRHELGVCFVLRLFKIAFVQLLALLAFVEFVMFVDYCYVVW